MSKTVSQGAVERTVSRRPATGDRRPPTGDRRLAIRHERGSGLFLAFLTFVATLICFKRLHRRAWNSLQ